MIRHSIISTLTSSLNNKQRIKHYVNTHNSIDSKKRKGRPRMKWLDDVESDVKKMKVKGWKKKMRNRGQWRLVVEEAKAHTGL
jgi:hypothetical protein